MPPEQQPTPTRTQHNKQQTHQQHSTRMDWPKMDWPKLAKPLTTTTNFGQKWIGQSRTVIWTAWCVRVANPHNSVPTRALRVGFGRGSPEIKLLIIYPFVVTDIFGGKGINWLAAPSFSSLFHPGRHFLGDLGPSVPLPPRGGDLSTERLFFGIYKFKFYHKTVLFNCHVFLCDLVNEQKIRKKEQGKNSLKKTKKEKTKC